ncbi:MAG: hypothetical protein HY537_04840 [Deltaproteobacteria bacterium]|nr:hypothetical protein [Deltaproteobacteria bacterium]
MPSVYSLLLFFLFFTRLSLALPFHTAGEMIVETGNNGAFLKKLELVDRAQHSIDLAYFIYSDDFSSSYFTQKLIAKATDKKNPIKIRMLVDAAMTSALHSFFKMVVAKGEGNISVAYFRPPAGEVYSDLKLLGFDNPHPLLDAIATYDVNRIRAELRHNRYLRASRRQRTEELLGSFTLDANDTTPLLPFLEAWENKQTKAYDENSWLSEQIEALREAVIGHIPTGAMRQVLRKARLHPGQWLDLTKRLHHKILLVDGEWMMGGGRNIEDSYHWEFNHPVRVDEAKKHDMKYVFMDVDFLLQSDKLSRLARKTFDAYWTKMSVTEKADLQEKEVHRLYADLKEKAERFAPHVGHSTPDAIQGVTFRANNVDVAYVENTMLLKKRPGSEEFKEEASQLNEQWARAIREVKTGDEILIHNAYVYFQPSLQLALVEAIRNGARVTIQTNSHLSSDLGFISQLARRQYKELLELGKRHQAPGKPNPVQIFEYYTAESLHAKVSVLGNETLMVGSSNADPRCEFLDTNNAILIRDRKMAADYSRWLTKLRKKLFSMKRATREGDRVTPLQSITLSTLKKEKEEREAALQKLPPDKRKRQVSADALLDKITALSFEDTDLGKRAREFLRVLFLQL